MLTHRNVNVCKYKAIMNNNHTKKPKPKKKKQARKQTVETYYAPSKHVYV